MYGERIVFLSDPPLLRPVVIYWEIVNCDNLVDIYVYHQLLEPIVTGEIIWV